jgi:hypothetical protein
MVFVVFVFSRFRSFRIFTFPHISRFRTFRNFAHFAYTARFVFRIFLRILCSCIFRAFRVSDSLHFRASHELCTSHNPTQFAICAGFAFSRISRISHSHVFRISACATVRLPGVHHILFTCPVLILQGPLVHISLGFTRVISHMSLHSHLCSFISLCVYITSPLYV